MRDPAVRIFDPEAEAAKKEALLLDVAIEETVRFLIPCMRHSYWKGEKFCTELWWLIGLEEIQKSSLPEWLKDHVCELMVKTRPRKKPTRSYRDSRIVEAANRLKSYYGYELTRNDARRDVESASSIIREALRRLGVKMAESTIKEIIVNSKAGRK